jgi:DNA polymerase
MTGRVRARDLTRYVTDLGWREALELPEGRSTPLGPDRAGDLGALADLIEGCERCRLCERRNTIVFGEGDPDARLMFIGEGPGSEEDRSGRPFVGQAGRLLDAMIFALGFSRGEVYIGNVVKCRPPGNRDPQQDEMAACSGFLERQIDLIGPRVIVTLGRIATQHLLESSRPMGALRGRWASFRGTPVLPMFHPAYLLRTPLAKRQAWADLKEIRAYLARSR